jgi:hypothetical protein
MNPKISFTVTEEEHKELKALADQKNISLTNYISEKLGLIRDPGENLTLRDVLRRLPKNPGELFSIPDLFEKEEWDKFTKGSRLATGRAFYKAVTKLGKTLTVQFVEKNSANLAIYRTE